MGNHPGTTSNLKKKKLQKKRKNRNSSGFCDEILASEKAAGIEEEEETRSNKNGNGLLKRQEHQKHMQPPASYPGLCDNLLTEDQVRHIQASWLHLEGELQAVLTEAFLMLFTEHPDVKEKFFEFKNYTIADLRKSNKSSSSQPTGSALLQRHVPRVARAISKVVSNLESLDKVVEYLQVLGKIHNQNGIKSHEISLLGPYFVSCSVSHLPSHLRERRFQEAWLDFFSAINLLMGRGFPEVDLVLSPVEKALVRSSFRLAKEGMATQEAAVIKLSQTYSTSHMRLPVRGVPDPRGEMMLAEAMDNHGMLLLKVAEEVVKDLDDKEKLDQYLNLLGRFHEKCEVSPEYLDVMGPLFCQTIGPVLQASSCWDNETRETWLRLFRIIAFQMKKGYLHTARRGSKPPFQLNFNSACNTPRIRLSPERDAGGQQQSLAISARSPGSRPLHLYQKNQQLARRRISMDELNERKVRLQAQHCHIYHQRKVDSGPRRGSGASVVNDIHDYKSSSNYLLPLAASETRRWSSYNCVLSGSSAALIMKASAAAAEAEAKAKAKRRSSLHQLFTLGVKSSSRQEMRPRSSSAPFANDVLIKK